MIIRGCHLSLYMLVLDTTQSILILNCGCLVFFFFHFCISKWSKWYRRKVNFNTVWKNPSITLVGGGLQDTVLWFCEICLLNYYFTSYHPYLTIIPAWFAVWTSLCKYSSVCQSGNLCVHWRDNREPLKIDGVSVYFWIMWQVLGYLTLVQLFCCIFFHTSKPKVSQIKHNSIR